MARDKVFGSPAPPGVDGAAGRLDRVIEGLEVDVEPAAIPGGTGIHVLALACGTTIRLSRRAVLIVPSGRGHGAVPAGARRIRVTYHGLLDLFEHLDRPLVARFDAEDPLRHCAVRLVDEMLARRPGRRAMTATLLRELLILLLRRCAEGRHLDDAWLAAVDDPRLARALAAMRHRPDHTFTLAELADLAGMSRTVFAARFAGALARPPFQVLTRIRLERAAELLTRTELPVKSVAARVGYASRSSFTRAFLATYGAAPTTFRRDGSLPLSA